MFSFLIEINKSPSRMTVTEHNKIGCSLRSETILFTLMTCFLLTAASVATANSLSEGWHSVTADPVSPSESRQYYQEKAFTIEARGLKSKVMSTSQVSVGIQAEVTEETLPAEIVELVRGLENDPLQIFNYVKTRLQYEIYFGHRKSSLYTLKQRSGNDFDLANLLKDLMKAAGYESSLVKGTMVLSSASASNWLGVEDALGLADDALSNTGVPYEYAQGGLRISRVWLKLEIEGQVYHLDPAFKRYNNYSVENFRDVLGYDRDEFLASVQEGATVTDDYVQNLNYENLAEKLNEYSMNLHSELKNNYANHQVEELLGGRLISSVDVKSLASGMEFSYSEEESWDGVPVEYQSIFRVQLHGIDQSFATTELMGQSLSVDFNNGNFAPRLLLSGEVIAQGNPSSIGQYLEITLSMDHPLSARDGSYTDSSATAAIQANSTHMYSIPIILGNADPRAEIESHYDRIEELLASGASKDDPRVHLEGMAILGKRYGRQLKLGYFTLSKINHVQIHSHHTYGLIKQERSLVVNWVSAVDSRWGTKAGLSWIEGHSATLIAWMIGSSLEHSILEQMYGPENPGLSSVRGLYLQNQSGDRNYFLHKDNVAAHINDLSGYSLSRMQDFQDGVSQSGFILLPANGQLQLGQWKGSVWISYGTTGSLAGYLIGGALYGGHSSTEGTVETEVLLDWSDSEEFNSFFWDSMGIENPISMDPVDLATGHFLFSKSDLSLGAALPNGLNLARNYNSGRAGEPGSLGNGWNHSLEAELKLISDPDSILGLRSPMDMVAMYTYAYVIGDIYRSLVENPYGYGDWSYGQDGLGQMVTVLGCHWLTDQFLNNSLVLNMGDFRQSFFKLPDGSFESPPGSQNRLATDQQGRFVLTNSKKVTYQFDTNNQLESITDTYGNASIFNYNNEKLSRVTDAYGRYIDLSWSGELLSGVSDSTGREVSYGYDGNANLVSVTDAENAVWQFEYDAENNLHKVIAPIDGEVAINMYDDLHRVKQQKLARQTGYAQYDFLYTDYRNAEIAPGGGRTTYYFDHRGRTVKVQNALGEQIQKEYDGQDHLISVTDSTGKTRRAVYRDNDQVRSIDSEGYVTRYEHDADGRVVKMIAPTGEWVDYEYNTQGSLIRTQNSLGIDSSISYDARGRASSVTDAKGVQSNFSYDGFGNLTSSSTPGFGDFQQTASMYGDRLTLTDQNGALSAFAYDDMRRPVSFTDSLGSTSLSVLDDQGRVVQSTDRNQKKQMFAYSSSGKLETTIFSDGSNLQFQYNVHDNLVSVSNDLGTINYDYDQLRRVVKKTDVHGFDISYEFDASGNLLAQVYHGGRRIEYGYDRNSRVTYVRNWLGETTEFGYDPAGRLIEQKNFNGSEVSFGYDTGGRLVSKSETLPNGGVLADYSLVLDDNGNVVNLGIKQPIYSAPGTESRSYTYYPDSNRILSDGDDQFHYDDEGRLASVEGSLDFEFNERGRLAATTGDVQSTLNYDATANLAVSRVNGLEVRYVYNNMGQLVALMNQDNQVLLYFIHANGLLAAISPEGGSYTYHHDFNGNTVALTDSENKIVNAYAYDAFGKRTNVFSTLDQPFMFGGQFGALHLFQDYFKVGVRVYSARLGRFVSEDPIGFSGGDVNLYAYAGNNPVNFIDSDGYASDKAEAIGSVAGWGVAGAVGLAAVTIAAAPAIATGVAAAGVAVSIGVAVAGVVTIATVEIVGSQSDYKVVNEGLNKAHDSAMWIDPAGKAMDMFTGGAPTDASSAAGAITSVIVTSAVDMTSGTASDDPAGSASRADGADNRDGKIY